jgi:hypothetical protein
MLRGGITQSSQESPRFWGLHMEGKSVHMADFSLLGRFLFTLSLNIEKIIIQML